MTMRSDILLLDPLLLWWNWPDYGRAGHTSQCLGAKKPRRPQGARSAVGRRKRTKKNRRRISPAAVLASWLPILPKQDFWRNQLVKEGNALR